MDLIGKDIIHSIKGAGTIVEQEGNKFIVEFADGTRTRFLYPKSFENFLSTTDESLMEAIKKDLETHLRQVSSRIQAMSESKKQEIEEK